MTEERPAQLKKIQADVSLLCQQRKVWESRIKVPLRIVDGSASVHVLVKRGQPPFGLANPKCCCRCETPGRQTEKQAFENLGSAYIVTVCTLPLR